MIECLSDATNTQLEFGYENFYQTTESTEVP